MIANNSHFMDTVSRTLIALSLGKTFWFRASLGHIATAGVRPSSIRNFRQLQTAVSPSCSGIGPSWDGYHPGAYSKLLLWLALYHRSLKYACINCLSVANNCLSIMFLINFFKIGGYSPGRHLESFPFILYCDSVTDQHYGCNVLCPWQAYV